jgi:hypothetical protein
MSQGREAKTAAIRARMPVRHFLQSCGTHLRSTSPSEGDFDGEIPDLRGVVHRGKGDAVAGGAVRGRRQKRERWMEGL